MLPNRGMVKRYREKEWLKEQYHEKQLTAEEIGVMCEVSKNTILNWLHKHDIQTRSKGAIKGKSQKSYTELQDESKLKQLYHGEGLSTEGVATRVGCTKQAVQFALERHGIERRGATDYKRDIGSYVEQLNDEEWLQKQYHEEERSIESIARELDVTGPCVKYWFDKLGIERRNDSTGWGNTDTQYQEDPNWNQKRENALRRDEYECQDCGLHEDDYERSLDVHHTVTKDSFKTEDGVDWERANALKNLVSLCRSCHIKRHHNAS